MHDERIVTFNEIEKEAGFNLPDNLLVFIANETFYKKLKIFMENNIYHKFKNAIQIDQVKFAPPLTNPEKIWCIGLNYQEHALDLDAVIPTEPASFMKPNTTLIGHMSNIVLPRGYGRITGESEMAMILGKTARNVREENALDHLFGIMPAIDMTALDILQKNPRFLTRAKSFDTFLSTGPFIFTMDELDGLDKIEVSTVKNGKTVHRNFVSSMMFAPEKLISFHSSVFTFNPGDIILSGTPGAVEINPGDIIEARLKVKGMPVLANHAV